jgi:lipopolysaccharide exporter
VDAALVISSRSVRDIPPVVAPGTTSRAEGIRRLVVRAGAWTVATSLAARLLGVIGTLILTRFVAPYAYGAVTAATVIVWTANQLSALGVGTYVVARPEAERPVMFHATVVHVGLGILGFGIALAIGGRLGSRLDAPSVGRYLPGMVLALFFERVNFMPERVLVRAMRFDRLAIVQTAGDVAYSAVSLVTAVRGWEGMAIVAGNLARSGLRFAMLLVYVSWRDWIEPSRLRGTILRDMTRFGAAVYLGGLASFGVRRWDAFAISYVFGPAVLGQYNLAYSLADLPAVQVGDQIGDVLQVVFARLDPDERSAALLRSIGVLALVMTPMVVGLACVAHGLAAFLFNGRWSGVAPMLAALAAISFPRPLGRTVGAYLQVCNQPRLAGLIEVLTLVLLLVALLTIGRVSPVVACLAVVLVFFVRLLIFGMVLSRVSDIRLLQFLAPMLPPIFAALPMAAGVFAVSRAFSAVGIAGARVLAVQISTGTILYALGALVFARRQVGDIFLLVRKRHTGR